MARCRSVILTEESMKTPKLWKQTIKSYLKNISDVFLTKHHYYSRFYWENEKNETTTLGRGGSDFSAAIFAYCGDAKEVIIRCSNA